MLIRGISLVLMLILFQSCKDEEESSDVLRVAVLPDIDPEKMKAVYAPLFKYLNSQEDLSCELIIPKGYADTVRMFKEGEVDIAFFGGFTFIKANIENDAQALVMRGVDRQFQSVVLTMNRQFQNLEDLKGKKFSFGSKMSTSGNLMPRYYFEEKGIAPETFFNKVVYSGAHDKTVELIMAGDVDAGVCNKVVYEKMLAKGEGYISKVKVLWESPYYTDYVWAGQKSLPQKSKLAFIKAFLALSSDKREHKDIMTFLGAEIYYPADISDFSKLIEVSKSLKFID